MKTALLLAFTFIAVRFAAGVDLSEHPVVHHAKGASSITKKAAADLADRLGRMTGKTFTVDTDAKAGAGITLGTWQDWPNLTPHPEWQKADISRREEYVIRTHQKGIHLIGSTELGVRHAVWDLLHRLGYRQFFPGKNWEVVPKRTALAIEADLTEAPDYHARRIWFGFGPLTERESEYNDWCERNRATSGIDLISGHSYDAIMNRQKVQFAAHPEYLALVGGVRQKPKFCISNAQLRDLVVQDALQLMAVDADADSISMDPSDGGGWCECAECAKLGSVSDRALLLANQVAHAVGEKYPGRVVGMYAYNEHSPPPAVKAEPNVVISVATGFIRGGFTIDELLSGWSKQAQTLGIREYYSVNTWDRDLPGAARGGNISYLKETIPHFHQSGARYMSAESSDNWGPNGLGYYLTARMLWDVREAGHTDDLVEDFIARCFGSAAGPMRKYYKLLDGTKRQALSDDLIGRMYRLLREAYALAGNGEVAPRLDDLTSYTRYAELFLDYSGSSGAAHQSAFEKLFRHVWRMRQSGMIHVKGLWRDLPNRDKTVKLPPLGTYSDPDATNPWKSGPPFTQVELQSFIEDGILQRKLLDFEPVSYSSSLVPAAPLKLVNGPRGNAGIYLRGVRDFWTWVQSAPSTLSLQATAGVIYQQRGPAKFELYPQAEAESKSVAHQEVAPDRAAHAVDLQTKFSGLHRIQVSDATQGTNVTWPDGMAMTIVSSTEQPAALFGRWHLYFYVPKGTTVVGGFADGAGLLLDPNQKVACQFTDKPGYFSVPVPKGMDGQLWSFKNSAGSRLLMTVPPCLARDASELLLPSEVVQKDAVK